MKMLLYLRISSNVTTLHALTINSKKPVIFQGLHIYGYPGIDNAANSFINPSIIKPDSSSGLLSSEVFKNGTNSDTFDMNSIYDNIVNWFVLVLDPGTTSNNGNKTLYYGTTAPTTEGYSGGPVVDSHNKVLGIIIFSIESDNAFKQQLRFTSSLFLSSQYIIQLCKKNHVPIKVVNS